VADWLAHCNCGPEITLGKFPTSDTPVLIRPAPENEQLDSTRQQEELEGATEPSGAELSEPSSGDFLSSHSQWSADSSDSDALSSRWWSLSVPSTEPGSQGGVTGGGNGKKQLLPINR
jgi:hypothetical protein